MTTTILNLTQLNAILRGTTAAASTPTFVQPPYLIPEIFEGDVVNFSPGVSADSLSSPTVLLNAISQGFGYTTVVGDAGKIVIVTQVATAINGSHATSSSNPTTITAPIKFKDLNYDGAGVEGTDASSNNPIYFNSVFDSRGFGAYNTQGGPLTGNGTLTFSALSGSGVTATVSNTVLSSLFVSTDIGKTIIVGGVDVATVTGYTDGLHVTVTLNVTLTKFAFGCWYLVIPLDSNGFPLVASNLVYTLASTAVGSITSAYIAADTMTVVSLGATTAVQVNDLITGTSVLANTRVLQQLSGNPGETGQYRVSLSQSVGSSGSPVALGIASEDGQIAGGTYQGTYVSRNVGTPAVLTTDGATTAGTVLTIVSTVGATTTFTLTFVTGATVTLRFSQAISFLDIPYDGSSTSSGKGMFRPEAIAHYAQFARLRNMDLAGINFNTEVDAADRARNYAQFAVRWQTSFTKGASTWERQIEFFNAVYLASGSRLKEVWWNISGLATVAYATSLATLLNATLNAGIKLVIEVGNEPWNFSFALEKQWMALGLNDAHVLTNYGLSVNPVLSVTANGTASVTVKTTAPLASFVDPTTGTPWIVNGAAILVENESTGIWDTPLAGSLHLGSTITVTASDTFTYTANAAVPAQTMAPNSQWSAWFNTASNLVLDWAKALGQFNVFTLSMKYGVRQTYLIQQQWKTLRPNDRFVLNIQTYGQILQGGNDIQPIHYAYGDWLSGTYFGTGPLSSWLYGAAIAPYVVGTSGTTSNTAAFWTSVATDLATTEYKIRGHVYACKSYGIHPMAYEAGPDFSGSPAIAANLHNDPRAGALVVSLLDTWFRNGGEGINWFHGSPVALANGKGNSGWALNRYYGEQSTKMAAFASYSTVRNYNSGYVEALDLTNTYYRRTSPKRTGIAAAPNTGVYWSSNATARLAGYVRAFPRRRRYALTVRGTDSTAGTAVTVWMDNVQIGTATLPANGSGSVATSAWGPATTPPVIIEIPAGGHAFEVKLAAGMGTNPSIAGIGIVEA